MRSDGPPFIPQDEPFLQNSVSSAKLASCLLAVRVGARPHSGTFLGVVLVRFHKNNQEDFPLFFFFPFQEQSKYHRNDLLLD